MLCASCKNKTSSEQCPTLALKNLEFCGRHVRSGAGRLWSVINNIQAKVINIQKIFRGYNIRRKLKLLNPCKNKTFFNAEDPVTLETLDPMQKFVIDKWQFDIGTMSKILNTNLIPCHPCTREPLNIETRKRIRQLTAKVYTNKTITICQILEESGFIDIRTNLFDLFSESEHKIFFKLVSTDLKALSIKFIDPLNLDKLITILFNKKNNYDICFIIMSAFFRI